MTTFYCMRHGKTEFNQAGVFQGGLSDSPLLDEGVETAKKAGNYLHDVSFDRVIISPQKRAQDTANAFLSEHPSTPIIETVTDIREMEFGSWDGTLEKNYDGQTQFEHLKHRPHLYDPTEFGGENFQTLLNRTKTVFENYAKEYPNDTILVVSHGLTLQTILKHFQGIPISDIRKGELLGNTSISIIESTNGSDFSVTQYNDLTHTL
ncbi:histidine phosphatase family protein [Vagococcus sp. JNUCC 83]